MFIVIAPLVTLSGLYTLYSYEREPRFNKDRSTSILNLCDRIYEHNNTWYFIYCGSHSGSHEMKLHNHYWKTELGAMNHIKRARAVRGWENREFYITTIEKYQRLLALKHKLDKI